MHKSIIASSHRCFNSSAALEEVVAWDVDDLGCIPPDEDFLFLANRVENVCCVSAVLCKSLSDTSPLGFVTMRIGVCVSDGFGSFTLQAV